MRAHVIALAALSAPLFLAAQEEPPTGFAALEMERSRHCVSIISRVDALNRRLQPLGLRSERIRMLQEAILLENRDIMESLDRQNDLESAVHAWFVADGRLAASFVESRNEDLRRQRTVGREQIKARVQAALDTVQTQARTIMEGEGDLGAEAGPCDGAILIRPAVVEACQSMDSPVCAAATAAEPEGNFRFVDTPDDLWDVQELRPWSAPGPLQVSPTGSLTGARSIAFARYGNVVLTVGFAPLIQPRNEISEEQAQRLAAVLDTLGFTFGHPDLIYAPSLAVRLTLPDPLAGEEVYVLHFGSPEEAEVVWSAPAGTGSAIESPAVLAPGHLARLQAGETLRLTAVRSVEGDDNEGLFTFELTNVNQARAVQSLLGYMAGPMEDDLRRLIPPGASR